MDSASFTFGPPTRLKKAPRSSADAVVPNAVWSVACTDCAVVSACSSPSAKLKFSSALSISARCWAAASLASDSELSAWTSLARAASEVPWAIWSFSEIIAPMGVA